MKKNFPSYKQGDLETAYKNLSYKNKNLIKDFLDYCKATSKTGSMSENKLSKIKRFVVQLYDITQINLYEQNKESVIHFIGLLNSSNRAKWTKNETKVYVRKFLKWHYKNLDMFDFIKLDGNREVNPQKINEKAFLTEEELEKMLRYAQNFKEKAYLFLAYESGARPQEMAQLRWKDVDFKDGFADITFYSGKTKHSRVFPVKRTREFLWEWKQNYPFMDVKPNDFIFVSRWRDKSMSTTGLNKIVKRMAEKSGVNKDVWNYLFRHARATELYDQLPTKIVEQLLGHKNMFHVYHNVSNRKAREQLLEKIYKVEKLTPENKEQIEELKIKLDTQSKDIEMLQNSIQSLDKVFSKMGIKESREFLNEYIKERYPSKKS